MSEQDIPQRHVVVVFDGHDAGARTYAEWLAEETGAASGTVEDAADPTGPLSGNLLVADTVIVVTTLGSDGTLGGADFVLDNWDYLQDFGRRVAIAVVGLSQVFDYDRLRAIENTIDAEKMTQLKFFQLRGMLDTSSLGMRDKIALRAQVAALKARPKRTPEEQAMLDNGGSFDFTHRKALRPLLRWVRGES